MYPDGGFITPNGEVIAAYGNHEAMCQVVGGTLKGVIQAGMVRFHVYRKNKYGTSIGIDAPRNVDHMQSTITGRIIFQNDPQVVIITRVGKRGTKVFGEEDQPITNANINRYFYAEEK